MVNYPNFEMILHFSSDEEEDKKDRMLGNENVMEQTEPDHEMSERTDVENFISRFFQQRFSQMDMSKYDHDDIIITDS